MSKKVSLIVAAAENGVIGSAGKIPWRLSGDMKFFKETTTGNTIIMGRSTYESIGETLPNRQNIVLSRVQSYQAPGCLVAGSLTEALSKSAEENVFIIGGSQVYAEALKENIVDTIYLTKVHAKPEGDTFFEFNDSDWQVVAQEDYEADGKNQYPYTFYTLKKK